MPQPCQPAFEQVYCSRNRSVGSRILSLIYLLFSIFVYAMRAFLLASDGGKEKVIDDCVLLQKSKSLSSSPARSQASSHSHRRSGSTGSNTAVVGVGLDASMLGDYRLHPTMTDDQASQLS